MRIKQPPVNNNMDNHGYDVVVDVDAEVLSSHSHLHIMSNYWAIRETSGIPIYRKTLNSTHPVRLMRATLV